VKPAPSTTQSSVVDLSERELVARIQSRLAPSPGWLVVGIGDDAAVLEPERNKLEVITVDALVEGVHFDRRFTPPAAIGHRALAVNLSDLAAMGAEPRWALLSLALPPALPCADFDGMIDGLAALARRHRVHVVGGNLTRSTGPLMLDITAAGSVKRRQVLQRSGARPGDLVFVTGAVGAAAAGLQLLSSDPSASDSCVSRYLQPEPRVREGLLIARNRAATACMDLSDGLADGLHRIAEASGVGMTIDADLLPLDQAARTWFDAHGGDAIGHALTGGDDYELVFTARPNRVGRLKALRLHGSVPFTKIGVCTEYGNVTLRNGNVDAPIPHGYKHFG
jgi:thiamine-monophosphate kinase